VIGAVSAVVAVIIVTSITYPVISSGDDDLSLFLLFVLGAIAGLVVSPISALLGAAGGYLLSSRRPDLWVTMVLMGAGAVLSSCFVIALGAWSSGDRGIVLWVGLCGAIAAGMATVLFRILAKVD